MLPSTGANWEIKKNLGEVECQGCGFDFNINIGMLSRVRESKPQS